MKDITINSSSEILNYKDLYNYNFVIVKDLLLIKSNILVLKKIASKFPEISINWLQGKNLYILINYYLFNNNFDFLYREYKIVMKWIWCNAKCSFCHDWKNKWDLKNIYLHIDDIINDIKSENIEIKTVDILWWEPLLIYEKILEIIILLKRKNIILTFTSNASLLNIEMVEKLINSWLEIFVFSIDFPSKKHNKFRSLKSAFENIIYFTKYIKDKWKVVNWNTIVWKFNINEILDFENIYTEIYPNNHTFIHIEKNNIQSNLKLFVENNKILELEDKLKSKLQRNDNNIILNWFRKNINKESKCHVPLYKKSYVIKNNKVNISPCYTHSDIQDFNTFTDIALKWKCSEICDSSFKKAYTFLQERLNNTL